MPQGMALSTQFADFRVKDSLKESTICGWKAYLLELESHRKLGKDGIVEELPSKKIGCPLIMGEDLDKQVQAYITNLVKVGGGEE